MTVNITVHTRRPSLYQVIFGTGTPVAGQSMMTGRPMEVVELCFDTVSVSISGGTGDKRVKVSS